jgi:hypothetical protein
LADRKAGEFVASQAAMAIVEKPFQVEDIQKAVRALTANRG